jgi:hypothetical protein
MKKFSAKLMFYIHPMMKRLEPPFTIEHRNPITSDTPAMMQFWWLVADSSAHVVDPVNVTF